MQVMSIWLIRTGKSWTIMAWTIGALLALALWSSSAGTALARQGSAGVKTKSVGTIKVAAQNQRRRRARYRTYYDNGYYGYQRRRYRRANARRKRRVRRQRSRRKTTRQTRAYWNEHKSRKGPVQIVISLPKQRMTVYKGGTKVASAPVSTGQRGHRTPAGVFSIIQKKRRHYSNLYRGAPMPYMQRITWSGIALHAGALPGYPASHGCIRLPHSFAKQLFRYTRMGAHVVVTSSESGPVDIRHANLFQPTTLQSIVEGPLSGASRQAEADGLALGSNDSDAQHLEMSTVASASDLPISEAGDVVAAAMLVADSEYRLDRAARYSTRSDLPIRILITRRTARERIKDAQRLLGVLGYGPGPVDGQAGRSTIGAVKRFQEAVGLPVTGTISDTLLDELYEASGQRNVSTGHIYVRQDFRDVFEAPIGIREPGRSLGTHLFTAMNFANSDSSTRWSVLSLQGRGKWSKRSDEGEQAIIPSVLLSAENALDRIEMPDHIRQRIADMLTPGSSLVISDNGMSSETGKGTDFVVLTR